MPFLQNICVSLNGMAAFRRRDQALYHVRRRPSAVELSPFTVMFVGPGHDGFLQVHLLDDTTPPGVSRHPFQGDTDIRNQLCKGGPFVQERKSRPPLRKADPLPEPTPPRSEEEEEKRACGLAMDLAMKWMKEGTAPAQVVVHFLKLQTTREKVELQKLRNESALAEGKLQAILIGKEMEKKYDEVINAIKSYSGKDADWETIPDDYPDDVDYRP